MDYGSQSFPQFRAASATEAGILYTSGDWVVTLDEDLQHPPALIEALLIKAVTDHCDIVYANPKNATHQNLLRDCGSYCLQADDRPTDRNQNYSPHQQLPPHPRNHCAGRLQYMQSRHLSGHCPHLVYRTDRFYPGRLHGPAPY